MPQKPLFLLLPHQLFSVKHLDKKYQYLLWEHPHYFTAYTYNQKKILLHRGSMRYYYEYVKKHARDIRYVRYTDTFEPGATPYTLFDPIDKPEMLALPGTFTLLDSPNFLLTRVQYTQYREKTDSFFFNAFYLWAKKELDILPTVKSQDKKNRKNLTQYAAASLVVPELPSNDIDQSYITRGTTYVHKHFADHYGSTNNFLFPLTHRTARAWLTHFITACLPYFGDYQDIIHTEYDFLFHSALSSSINIGLLNPSEIVIEVLKRAQQKNIALNNLEGYIRQLFWREYQRYCYLYFDFEAYRSPKTFYFNNTKRLTKAWYYGSLGIDPVDNCIVKAFQTGYLHHIERLMIIGSYMNIMGIHPWQGMQWFMEFSCDSYEWVMYQNVLEMVFFISGGGTMRRPYTCSSNYILKMSNYSSGAWSKQ